MATASGLYKEIDLSASQILNLGNTIELLPNVGHNAYYDIDKIIFEYTEGSSSFTFANYITLFYGGNRFVNINAELINNGENAFICVSPVISTENTGGVIYANPSFFQGSGVLIGTLDSTNPTDGNGTMKIKIWYSIRKFG